jgi:hypothetical protein
MTDKKAAVWLILFYIFLVLVSLLVAFVGAGHAATTSTQKRPNAIGSISYTENPFTYKAGTLSAVGLVDDGIVLRIQPLATYSLFTEDILFCNRAAVAEKFAGKANPMLITYKTRASRLVRGIGCHDLIRVDNLEGK